MKLHILVDHYQTLPGPTGQCTVFTTPEALDSAIHVATHFKDYAEFAVARDMHFDAYPGDEAQRVYTDAGLDELVERFDKDWEDVVAYEVDVPGLLAQEA